jgi:uncharacterized membrane protein SirB2
MSLLVLAACMSALYALWVRLCCVDHKTSLPHLIAVLLMLIGVMTFALWGISPSAVSRQWLMNGAAALIFGIAVWLAYDRRSPVSRWVRAHR